MLSGPNGCHLPIKELPAGSAMQTQSHMITNMVCFALPGQTALPKEVRLDEQLWPLSPQSFRNFLAAMTTLFANCIFLLLDSATTAAPEDMAVP